MDFFDVQNFYSQQFPGKKIDYEFDDNCHRVAEVIYSDGLPHEICHVECNRVKVTVEGQAPTYVKIAPHRFNTTWKVLKDYLNAKVDVFIHPDDLDEILKHKDSDPQAYQQAISVRAQNTGLSKEKIEAKVNNL